MAMSDVFVIYDSVQYTKRDWRNRNQIKTAKGLVWLTIPVQVKGKFEQSIKETKISDPAWSRKHLDILKANYKPAPCYSEMKPWLEQLYGNCHSEWITDINRYFLSEIASFLGVKTEFRADTDFEISEGKTDKLVSLCMQLGADEYLTGPAAKNYMDETQFDQAGISIVYSDYDNYSEYPQIHGEFSHHVSILDLILNTGTKAPSYLKHSQLV